MRCQPYRLLLILLVFAGSAIAQPARDAEAPAAIEKTGTYYTLTYHGGDEALVEQALAVVDAVWPIVAAAFGAAAEKPAQPLQVHLYRTPDGYRAADQKLTNGKFQRNLAMSHWDSKSAHVSVQPPCRDEVLRAIGLPQLTVAMLAWEATHVARFELCANFRQHPEWFVDGFAAWVTAQVLAARQPGPPEAIPFSAKNMLRVQQLLADKKVPPGKSLLADQVADLDLYDRYAVRVVFYSMLASEPHRSKLDKVIGTIRRTGGGNAYAKKVLADALSAFRGLDKDFAKFAQGLAPQWDEVNRSLATTGTEWAQIAFPDQNAGAWWHEPLRAKGFVATGSLRILPSDAQQMNFLFGRTDGGFYSIAFVADSGFTVFDYKSQGGQWDVVGKGHAPGLRLGVSTEFAVEARGSKLVVKLAGFSWEFELPRSLPWDIVWGVGAQAGEKGASTGAAGLWQNLSVLPDKP